MFLNQNEFYLVGWEARTNNNAEMSGNGIIGKMWEQAFKENLKEIFKEAVSEEIYAVYSNYESDEHGDYDYFIGHRVQDLSQFPEELKRKKVLAGPYKKFETRRGPVYQVVPEMWMHIWNTMGHKRNFKTDFEIYGSSSQDPNQAVVEIYIGVQSSIT